MPTEVSSAEETTTGRPMSSAIRRQARTPPSGCTLSTATSAASRSRTRYGSAARRIDSSAAIGTCTRRRTAASSSTEAHGCSTYSSAPAARSIAAMAATASSTSQKPLASTRTSPEAPSASRTASRRASASARLCPGSATFTFAVRQPPARTIRAACSAPTAGTVTFTGTRSRLAAGQPSSAASRAARSHGAATAASYSRNGLNSPHPVRPRISRPSRTVMPRNRVVIGIEKTCTSRLPDGRARGFGGVGFGAALSAAQPLHRPAVDLAVVKQGKRRHRQVLQRRPGPRMHLRHPVAELVEVRAVAGLLHHDGSPPLAPLRVRDPDDLHVPHRGVIEQPVRHCTRGHFDTARDDHVVDPAEDAQPPVVFEAAEVLGREPAALLDLGRELRL